MDSEQTCGKGLAQNSALPAHMSRVLSALADNLELHLGGLDLRDSNAQKEHAAYTSLTQQYRELSRQLHDAAQEMAGYHDLPMGAHDMAALSTPEVAHAFERFVAQEDALLVLLQRRISADHAMLSAMGEHTGEG